MTTVHRWDGAARTPAHIVLNFSKCKSTKANLKPNAQSTAQSNAESKAESKWRKCNVHGSKAWCEVLRKVDHQAEAKLKPKVKVQAK
jgi:hypothetical protein